MFISRFAKLASRSRCTSTATGATVSNTLDGLGMPPLALGAQVHLDVVDVPGAANTLPGRDLTVTIRL